MTIRGIVTGVDDLYGSTFDAIYEADSGIWVQEATHDPAATTSEGIFVAGVKRDPASPTAAVGDDVTIRGTIVTQFGLVELVPPGVGSVSSPAATEVNLPTLRRRTTSRRSGSSSRSAPTRACGPGATARR